MAALMTACGSNGSAPIARTSGFVGPTPIAPTAAVKLTSLTLSVAQVSPAMRGKPFGPVTEPRRYLYTGLMGPDNATLSAVCGVPTFPSDADRVARRQVAYIQHGFLAASQEVVRYRSGGAALALRELRSATRSCPKSFPITKGSVASKVTIDPPNPDLLAKQLTMQFSITQPNGPRTWEVDVYQFDGNYLSAFYVFNSTLRFARSTAFQLASLAAAKLAASGA